MWVHDKLTGLARLQNVRDTAVQTDYYEVLEAAGAMETLLGKVESAASVVIEQICTDHSLRALDHVAIQNLALFLAVQAIRTPSFFSVTERVLGEDADAVLIPRRTTPLLTSPKHVNGAAALIRERCWTLRVSRIGEEYLLSDHPLGFFQFRGASSRGFSDTFRHTTIHLPISPTHCFLLFPKQQMWIPGTRQVSDGTVLDEAQESIPQELLQLNTHQVVMSKRFVFQRQGHFSFVEECLSSNPKARQGPLTTDIGAVTWNALP